MGGLAAPPWHVRDPAALAALESEIASEYPTLRVHSTPERVLIKGAFPVRDGAQVVDWYRVEIELAADHPRALPRVRETGGRIPWQLDRHVLSDGTACVVLPDAYWIDNATGLVTLREYLAGPLHEFFLGQSVVALGDPWPQGEWEHGAEGLLQHYTKKLEVDSAERVCRLLLAIVMPVKGHLPCPCGSQRRFRNCHRSILNLVQERVPRARLLCTLDILLKNIAAKAAKAT